MVITQTTGQPYSLSKIYKKSDFILMKDVLDMSGGFKDGSYILPFEKEDPDSLIFRKKATPPDPVYGSELKSIYRAISANDNEIRHDDKDFSVFEKNCDKRNTDLIQYAIDGVMNADNMGHMHFIVDRGDGEERDVLPYVYSVDPVERTEYKLDDNGRLVYLKFPEFIQEIQNEMGSASFNMIKHAQMTVYRVFDKENMLTYTTRTGERYDSDTKDESIESEQKLDFWPIYTLEMNGRYYDDQLPMSRYFAQMRKSIGMLNTASLQWNEMYKNCFQMLAAQGKGNLELGSNRVIRFDNIAPSWITPNMDVVMFLQNKLEAQAKEIREDMNSTIEISSAASGEARQSAERERIENLKSSAKKVQKLIEWIHSAYVSFQTRESDFEFNVVISQEFQETASEQDLAEIMDIKSMEVLSEQSIKAMVLDFLSRKYSQNRRLFGEILEFEGPEGNSGQKEDFDVEQE